jgi:holo-[acyl-carrier protein] synthase
VLSVLYGADLMNIAGTGVDVTEVVRMRAALEHPRTGTRFRARVFTPGEQAYCERRGRARYESYAARFAAKEATMKALGVGWGRDVSWLEIEVVRERDGRPEIVLAGNAAVYAARTGIARLHLALTHTAELALAHVIAEREP